MQPQRQVGESGRCGLKGCVLQRRRQGHSKVEERSWRHRKQLSAAVKQSRSTERFDTIVIGGGQAGLAVGYYLKKQGRLIRDPRRERAASAAPGGRAPGTRFACSLPRATTGCRAGRFPRPAGRSQLRARRPITSRPTRRDSIFRCEPVWRVTRLAKDGDRYVVESRRASLRGRPRRRGDGLLREAVGAGLRVRARPSHRADALQRIPRIRPSCGRAAFSLVGAGNSGADIGMEVLEDSPDLALRKRQGSDPIPDRAPAQALWSCRCSGSSPRTS